ncbi:arginase family protein [Piscicoccus intestinalis]|uniref:arginase family protein n=1 Tax=Piscicoccus intestinalis TaxID=746033 RepID=UPI000838351D|nr:arginase family protein [Piscicoccus intestinalis]
MTTSDAIRLVWPQWQGADPATATSLVPELPSVEAQRGYALGATLLDVVAGAPDCPTVVVPVSMETRGLTTTDGVYAREVVLDQLRTAVRLLAEHAPRRITTYGGECSVSVAPFAHLASLYGQDLAIVWIDSHPDTGMPEADYDGYHAMAVSHLLGHGDAEIVAALPATVDAFQVALAGVHEWDADQEPFMRGWGLSTFSPDDLRDTTEPLLDWLRGTGCSKVAVHFDVDTVDSNEIVLGLGAVPGGLTAAQAARTINDLAGTADLVGLTIAEYVPRQVIAMRRLLEALPRV